MAKLPMKDLEEILAATLSGMTVDQFQVEVKKWLATAKHPRFNRPYTDLTYQPMLEVLKFFRANGYKTYIVTGGGQDFVRVYAEQVYDIPPEQVAGTVGSRRSTASVTETEVSESMLKAWMCATTAGRECSSAIQTSHVIAMTTPTPIKPRSSGRGIRDCG